MIASHRRRKCISDVRAKARPFVRSPGASGARSERQPTEARGIAAELPGASATDGVDAPSERRHCAPEKTPDELRVKTRRQASMEQATIIGIDISKRSFQLHGATEAGDPVFRKKLSRSKLLAFLSEVPPCLVVMEACGGAHHRGRPHTAIGAESAGRRHRYHCEAAGQAPASETPGRDSSPWNTERPPRHEKEGRTARPATPPWRRESGT